MLMSVINNVHTTDVIQQYVMLKLLLLVCITTFFKVDFTSFMRIQSKSDFYYLKIDLVSCRPLCRITFLPVLTFVWIFKHACNLVRMHSSGHTV